MTDRELMQAALEVLDSKHDFTSAEWRVMHYRIFEALRARLAQPERTNQCGETCERATLCAVCAAGIAQPEPEPCNWVVDESVEGNLKMSWMLALPMKVGTKLYTAPPQRKWQSLTDEEIEDEVTLILTTLTQDIWPIALSRAIEAKLKEKNA